MSLEQRRPAEARLRGERIERTLSPVTARRLEVGVPHQVSDPGRAFPAVQDLGARRAKRPVRSARFPAPAGCDDKLYAALRPSGLHGIVPDEGRRYGDRRLMPEKGPELRHLGKRRRLDLLRGERPRRKLARVHPAGLQRRRQLSAVAINAVRPARRAAASSAGGQ